MMGIRKLNKIVFLFITLLLFAGHIAMAQVKAFKYEATVQKVDSNGIYRIELTPDLIAKSNNKLSDIRIIDNDGKFIAYELSNKITINYPNKFIVFPQIAPVSSVDTTTTYIAENKSTFNINQLWIKLKNTGVYRTINISGSDDLKKWFAVKEGILLEEAGNDNSAEYEQPINLPTSNYRYFCVQVNDKNKAPVKILQAGIYTANLHKPDYTQLPNATLSVKDTVKVSHLLIKFDKPYQINSLHFNIASPKYYSRRVVIYDAGDNQVADTTITSAGTQNIFLAAKTGVLHVDVYNEDDNALSIKAVAAFQLKEYAVSYLEKGNSYRILTGNSSAPVSEYDLSFLNSKDYNLLLLLNISSVYNNPLFTNPAVAAVANHTVWLWSAIIIVLLLLSFFTMKMVKEIK